MCMCLIFQNKKKNNAKHYIGSSVQDYSISTANAQEIL